MKRNYLYLLALIGNLGAASSEIAWDPAMQKMPVQEKVNPPKSEVFAIQFDVLVWDSKEEGLEYGYKNTKTQLDQQLIAYEPKMKFEPAFRIGLSGFLPYDKWVLKSVYTYYATNRKDTARHSFDTEGTVGPGILATWTYPSAFANNNIAARFEKANSHWKLHASLLDLSLSRPRLTGALFTILPEFGIRSALLQQRYTVHYSEGNLIQAGLSALSSSINMNCASKNLGPFFGCAMGWRLGKNWDLFSQFSGSILASRFHVGRGETDFFIENNLLQTESIRLHSEYWAFRTQGQIALGFRFFDSFSYGNARTCPYSISAAYETQIWWRQNGLLRYLDTLNSTSSGAYVTPTQGDLMFHGVNLEASFGF